MQTCAPYERMLLFFETAELSPEEQELIKAHLQTCSRCRKRWAEIQRVRQNLAELPTYQPEESILLTLRNRLAHTLHRRSQPDRGTLALPRPAFQLSLALLLLALGFGLGRLSAPREKTESMLLQQLMTAAKPIRTADSEIDPYIGEIDRVRYDAKTGRVDIHYHTINNIVYRGKVQHALVKHLLQQALVEEQNPSTRLYAVKTMQAIANTEKGLDGGLLSAIESLLQKEQNPGVRLTALRVLKSVPMNEAIKNMLVRILLYDQSTALRIQAFESLTGQRTPEIDMENLLKSVQSDTSSYIRLRANELLQQIQAKSSTSTSRQLSREG